ncbi:uncharacterized protein BDFB_008782 [Asbolus verrucosus]|uniref:Protein sleepless n=1 Tax=Asbolus verrucosus TaxID=1661398 RepID=A0A482WBR7_ASBVE|nr:uncharacterized protein BDFB_008782 [Asbolus verrucosus]
MKASLVLLVLCAAVGVSLADLQCYQCENTLQECEVSKAPVIKCGNNGVCDIQVKKGADRSKAIRKCVIPDAQGKTSCTNGYDCQTCKTDLCNSATLPKIASAGWIAVVFAALYI